MRHPNYNKEDIAFVSGCVGEGGDHVNITLKNTGDEAITIKGDEVVCIIQLKTREGEVESADTGKDGLEEKSENRENVLKKKSSTGDEVQESSRVKDKEASIGNVGAVDESGDNRTEEKVHSKTDEPMETEPMETEEPEVGARADEELSTEKTKVPEEEKAQEGKTGLTPDKIDLAACKTPAKKRDEQTSSTNGDDSK